MSGTLAFYSQSGGSSAGSGSVDYELLCDINTGIATRFLRRYSVSASGAVSFADTMLDGVTAYVTTGLVGVCPAVSESPTSECFVADADGDGYVAGDRLIQVLFWDVSATPNAVSEMAWYNATTGATLTAEPIPADLRPCGLTVTPESFCYTAVATGTEWTSGDTLRYIRFYDSSNRNDISLSGELWWNVTTGAPITTSPVISVDVVECPSQCNRHEFVILCDDDGAGTVVKFLRHFTIDCGGTIYVSDSELDGNTPYDPVGTVDTCGSTSDSYITLCDTVTTPATPPAAPVTVNAPDVQDAEQKTNAGGFVLVNDDDIQFGLDPGNNDKIGAIRFALNVPQGATITSAYIQFTCNEASGNVSALTIQAEAADDAAPFVAVANSLALRPKTAATVNWSPAAWVAGAAGPAQKTPDIKSVVQEVTDRAGWAANNDIAIYIDGNGMRDAESLFTPALAPVLTVTYTTGAAGSPETTVTNRFYRKVIDGVASGDYWIDPDDETWKPYTVQGDVSACADDKHFEVLCMQDDAGQFSRVIAVDQATGTYSVAGDFTLDLTATYTPTGTVSSCQDKGDVDVEVITLCDDNGAFLRHIIHGDNGAVSMVYDTTNDGITGYTPVGAVDRCSDCCPVVIGNGCWDDGVNSGTYTALRDALGNVILVNTVDGAVVDAADVVTCASILADLTPNIQRLIGVGAIPVAAGARSVTVVVLAGAPFVQIAATPAVALVQGVSLGWGAGDGEKLADTFTFTGVAGSDFIVTTVF